MLLLLTAMSLAKLCARPGVEMGVPCDGCESWCNPDTQRMEECKECDCIHRLVDVKGDGQKVCLKTLCACSGIQNPRSLCAAI